MFLPDTVAHRACFQADLDTHHNIRFRGFFVPHTPFLWACPALRHASLRGGGGGVTLATFPQRVPPVRCARCTPCIRVCAPCCTSALQATVSLRVKSRGHVLQHGLQPGMLPSCRMRRRHPPKGEKELLRTAECSTSGGGGTGYFIVVFAMWGKKNQ